MSEYGIQKTGFVRKRLDEIVKEKDDAVKAVFGPDINLNKQTPDGQINQASALSDEQLWLLSERAFNATDPDKAVAIELSNLVKINKISRLEATRTTTALVVTGTPGLTVAASTTEPQQVSDNVSLQMVIEEPFKFDGTGTTTVPGYVVEYGPIPVINDTVVNIDTPVNGWDTVNNPSDALEGRLRETDAELRIRRSNSTAAASQNLIESLIGGVGNVPGVVTLLVLENDTDVTDANGLLPHTFEVIVEGGVDQDIADAIWINKPTGITAAGNSETTINDSQNLPHVISYTRPTELPVFVVVTITTREGFPPDGVAQIKQAIVDYSNGLLVQGRGFSVNDDVIYTELYTPINVVPYQDIDDLRIGYSATPTGQDNLPVGLREVSEFLLANIEVNITP